MELKEQDKEKRFESCVACGIKSDPESITRLYQCPKIEEKNVNGEKQWFLILRDNGAAVPLHKDHIDPFRKVGETSIMTCIKEGESKAMILKELEGVRSLCVADHNYKSFLEREIYIIRMKKKINSTMKFIERYDVFESDQVKQLKVEIFGQASDYFRELQEVVFAAFHALHSSSTKINEFLQRILKSGKNGSNGKWKAQMKNANPIGNEWKLHV